MDNHVRKFLIEEKASNTDHSHKCVAKKFGKWLSQSRLAKDSEKKLTLTRAQHKAVRE